MSYELFAAFGAATAILIVIPGPNVALIVANSVAHGEKYGFITVAGTSAAMVIQLALTVLGLTSILGLIATWFEWLRWLGVAYLVYLGVKAWTAPAADLSASKAQPKSSREVFWRGFLVSLTNPKTLLFYTAFLPQFVSADHDQGAQLVVLAATFLVIAIVLDGVWAMLAHRASRALRINGRFLNRLTGGCCSPPPPALRSPENRSAVMNACAVVWFGSFTSVPNL